MPEGLATADGEAIALDPSERDFHRAMAAPEPDEPEHAAPPRRTADPDAPFGRTKGGQPKRGPGGRPPRARVTETAPPAAPVPAKGKQAAPVTTDYTGALGDFTSAVWMVLAATPVPGTDLRIRLRAQAKILKDNQPGLCQGLNLMAQHNGTIRRGVELLTMGSAGWVLPACMAVAPFAVQSAQVWKSPPAVLGEMAAQTDEEWAEQFAAMQQAMGLDKVEQLRDLEAERDQAEEMAA